MWGVRPPFLLRLLLLLRSSFLVPLYCIYTPCVDSDLGLNLDAASKPCFVEIVVKAGI